MSEDFIESLDADLNVSVSAMSVPSKRLMREVIVSGFARNLMFFSGIIGMPLLAVMWSGEIDTGVTVFFGCLTGVCFTFYSVTHSGPAVREVPTNALQFLAQVCGRTLERDILDGARVVVSVFSDVDDKEQIERGVHATHIGMIGIKASDDDLRLLQVLLSREERIAHYGEHFQKEHEKWMANTKS